MGYWSDKLLNDAATHQTALQILCESGTLQTCERHATHFEGSGDVTAAYKLANYQLTQEGGATAEQRRGLTDAIKAAYEENSYSDRCERCAEERD